MKNKSKFVSLKRLLPILFILLLTSGASQGQSSVPGNDGRILRFYPNPAVTSITFDFQQSYETGYSIQIFNFLGKPVHDAKNLNQKTIIDLGNFNRGVYIYQLRNPAGRIVESGKFQVSK